jgi:hypothetical protein
MHRLNCKIGITCYFGIATRVRLSQAPTFYTETHKIDPNEHASYYQLHVTTSDVNQASGSASPPEHGFHRSRQPLVQFTVIAALRAPMLREKTFVMSNLITGKREKM